MVWFGRVQGCTSSGRDSSPSKKCIKLDGEKITVRNKKKSRFKKMITGMSILKLEIDNDGTFFNEMDTLFLENPKTLFSNKNHTKSKTIRK